MTGRPAMLPALAATAVTVVLAGAAVGTEGWSGAGWLVGLGVVLHLYPALLQRLLRARIHAVIDPSPRS